MPSTRSRTNKAALTIASSLVDSALGIVCAFVITPLVLRYLGDSLYGGWMVALQIVTYIGILDLHPMSILKLTLAKEQGSPDVVPKQRQIGAALVISAFVLPIYLVGGALLAYFLPMAISVSAEHVSQLRLAFSIAVAQYAIANFASLPTVVLAGMNVSYKAFGVNGFIFFITALFDYATVKLDLGLPMLAANKVLALAIKSVITFFVMKRSVEWFGLARPTREDLRHFLSLSVWMFVMATVYVAQNYSQLALVGVVMGPAIVTVYTMTSSLIVRIKGPVDGMIPLLRPGAGDLFGQGMWQQLLLVRRDVINILTGLVFVIGAVVVTVNPSFLALWVGQRYYAGHLVNLLFVAFLFQSVLCNVDSSLLESMLAIRTRSLIGLVSAVCSIGLGVTLMRLYGLKGFLSGLLVGNLFQSVAYPRAVANALRVSVRVAAWDATRPLVFALPALILMSAVAAPRLVLSSWARVALTAVAVAAGAAAWVWLVQFRAREREAVLQRFRSAARLRRAR